MPTTMLIPKIHTCWDAPDWDGTMAAEGECAGCDEAAQHPCRFCGYGHVFTTHNSELHADPDVDEPDWVLIQLCEATGLDCYVAFDRFFNTNGPYVEGVMPYEVQHPDR
jgi:hypothetical protein